MARRLTSYRDCQRFLAWIVNEVLAGRMEPGKGSKLKYIVDGIVKILETKTWTKSKPIFRNYRTGRMETMTKQRIQNQLRKIVRLQEERLTNAIPGMIKDYLINGKPINNEKALVLANRISNSVKESIENKLLPSMPCEAWMKQHGTVCQPLDYQGE